MEGFPPYDTMPSVTLPHSSYTKSVAMCPRSLRCSRAMTGEQLQYRTANVEDHARLDVAASGLWGSRFERTLIDVRVFNPYARSNQSAPRTTVYHRHEREKRRHYEERVRQVEHATFVPAVMSASGGMGKAATALYKRVASLLAAKRGE
eukprot:scpid36326/ scgid19687/ 